MSDDTIIPIDQVRARRADKSRDCRDWTVTDALRETLDMIERGELLATKVYIALECDVPDSNRVDYIYKCAGGTKLELLGLLTRHTHLTANA